MLSGAIKQGLTGGLIGGIMGGITGQGFKEGFKQGGLGGAVGGAVGAGVEGLFSPAYAGGGAGVDPMTTAALVPAETATRAAPNIGPGRGTSAGGPLITGLSTAADAASATTPQTLGLGSRLKDFFGEGGYGRTDAFASLVGGLGTGLGQIYASEAEKEQIQMYLDAARKKEKRITESYDVPIEALAGGETWKGDTTVRPTPGVKWAYDPSSGMIVAGA